MHRCHRKLVVSAAFALLSSILGYSGAVPAATGARASHGRVRATPSAPVTFAGLVHRPTGDARLERGARGLRISSIWGSGRDGVRIALGPGTTALAIHAVVPADSTLPAGAYLEISSRVRGAMPAESLGVLRITRASGELGYAVSGAVAGTAPTTVALYCNGARAYQDIRMGVSGVAAELARVPHPCLVCGSNLNDALGRSSRPGSRAEGASVLLRWQWSKVQTVTVVGRPGGAQDTTVDADEIRLMDPRRARPRQLSELIVRGRNLGEVLIESETPVHAGGSAR